MSVAGVEPFSDVQTASIEPVDETPAGAPHASALAALLTARPMAPASEAPCSSASDALDAGATSTHAFPEAEQRGVYRAIHERRDMRHFSGGSVEPEVLRRLLNAAHHAPSVGFMQPWRFVRITNSDLRAPLHELVEQERIQTAQAMGQRQDEFMRLKVQGVLDAAELLVVALADGREPHIFGRRTLPHMDLASASCAIQNLWLAARAEGLGMGWVSIFEPSALAQLLGMPAGAEPIALLCLGPVEQFYEEPMLQRERWAQRAPLESLVFDNTWGQPSMLWPAPAEAPADAVGAGETRGACGA